MLETDGGYGDEVLERAPHLMNQNEDADGGDVLAARRRIEQMRELKRLRDLLEDPDFDEQI
ncbi:hypothetical protein MARPU_10420 [Marichromatium purpuratum 984]|uniref:Uncharacterized protein n=1 Tax=Marichromatium purpuratum 984 TaxID=765910 RepID=W0E4V3_MARPU|nr:hypothetical protein [Marichromatium purpuratum]AHF04219.1 hypothetical protein MARPU_10420 [Marichromatium purpuratum 984]